MSAGAVSSMPPPAARRGQKRQHEQTLLDEDEWTDRIEAIIQRDYFPDLPKLQNKLEWLQVSSGVVLVHDRQCDRQLVVGQLDEGLSSCRPAVVDSLLRLQAVRSGDPSQLQQAQLNIAQRRAGIRTPVGATPAGFGTPGASLLRTPGLGVTPMAGTPSMTPSLGLNTGKYAFADLKPLSCSTSMWVSAVNVGYVPASTCGHAKC